MNTCKSCFHANIDSFQTDGNGDKSLTIHFPLFFVIPKHEGNNYQRK